MQDLHTMFAARLKRDGFSLTTPRKLVFAQLMKQEKQTMNQLIGQCRKIDRASVYRTIELFEQLGIIQRVYSGWKYRLELGEDFREHHHHALCRVCNRYINLAENSVLENRITMLARAHNFALEQHSLELRGICEHCRETKHIHT